MAAAPEAQSSSTVRSMDAPLVKQILWLPPTSAVKLNLLDTRSACVNSVLSAGPEICAWEGVGGA